jgi:amidase
MAQAPIWQWSAVKTAAAIWEGEVTCEEVAGAHVERLRAVNPALNAVVVDLGDQALARAREADRARARGEDLGVLHGVPVTIKINVDVEGQANSNGVAAFRDNIAPGDSAVTANLRAAGAILIGLTNTPEFSLRWHTDNPLHGQTLNPWDSAVTCGGSSGGAGASIAAGIGCIAHGNDIGGSLRWPASCNGIATIKPTQGRIPAFNPSAPAERPLMAQFMSSQGPLAREVGDVRLGLEAMSRRDPRDPWWVPAPLVGLPPDRPIKVAVAKMPADLELDPQIKGLIDRAAGHLSDAGYDVHAVETPDISAAWVLWRDLISTEIAALQAPQMRQLGSADFNRALAAILDQATILDGEGYMRAISLRTRFIRDWMAFLEAWPVVLAPAAVQPTPPPGADLGEPAAARRIFANDLCWISAINVLGLPAAVAPIGLVNGHPVGAQLIASRYREDLALDAAAAIEHRVGVLAHTLWAREARA